MSESQNQESPKTKTVSFKAKLEDKSELNSSLRQQPVLREQLRNHGIVVKKMADSSRTLDLSLRRQDVDPVAEAIRK